MISNANNKVKLILYKIITVNRLTCILFLALLFVTGCDNEPTPSLSNELVEGQCDFFVASEGEILHIPTVVDQQINLFQIVKVIPSEKDTLSYPVVGELSDTLRVDDLRIWKPEKGVAIAIEKNTTGTKRIFALSLSACESNTKKIYGSVLSIVQE